MAVWIPSPLPTSGLCWACNEYYVGPCPPTPRIIIDCTGAGPFDFLASCYYGGHCKGKVVYNGATAERIYRRSDCTYEWCSTITDVDITFSTFYASFSLPIWKDLEAGAWSSSVTAAVYLVKDDTGITASNVKVVHGNSVIKATQAVSVVVPDTGIACADASTLIATVTAYDDGTYTIT
jgi:hypothetical protein